MSRRKILHRITAALLAVILLTSDIPVNAVEQITAAEQTNVAEPSDSAPVSEEPSAEESAEIEVPEDSEALPVETEALENPETLPAETETPENSEALPAETETPEDSETLPAETEDPEAVPQTPAEDPAAPEADPTESEAGQENVLTDPSAEPEKTEDEPVKAEQVPEQSSAGIPEEETGEPAAEPEELTEEPAEESEEPEEDYEGLMSLEELEALPEDETGATMWKNEISLFRMAEGENWTFDAYYVNQDDAHYVEKTGNFNLKYQMEFHNSENIPANKIRIRIPAALFAYRDGTPVLPTDIAVPNATPEDPVSSRSTPFNYYVEDDDGTEYLVFFNYKDISSGSNAAWQILYKNLEIMEIVDMTTWELTPEITVEPSEEGKDPEVVQTEPLKGLVDSSVTLSSVTKTPYTVPGKNYGPGLYTESQVRSFIGGELPAEYSGDNFKNYRYVVWDVKIKGSGTQPWNLSVKDIAFVKGDSDNGEIVGYRNHCDLVYNVPVEQAEGRLNYYDTLKEECKEESWGCRFWVVTAHSAEKVSAGTILQNNIFVRLIPYDQIDEVQEKSATTEWTYADYHWEYSEGKIFKIKKEYFETYPGWLEVYREAAKTREDYGSFQFHTASEFKGYHLTHAIQSSGTETVGDYRDGTSYELTTVDDFMYVYPSGMGARMLGKKDYYFSSVTVHQTDIGFDVWEDKTAAPDLSESVDQKLEIYAMYGDSPGENWEPAGEVEWDPSGIMTYSFTPEQIAREPWRVKAVHRTINYSTSCSIYVTVCMKWDSPVMKEVMEAYKDGSLTSMRIENISGIQGIPYEGDTPGKYMHDDSTANGNYREPGLKEATQNLYGMLLQRANTYKDVTGLVKEARSFKTSKSTNDANNSRVLLDYCLTAYDGYEIYGEEIINYLKRAGLASPGRKAVVFYDLLPYGMRFDPSYKVTAGRITELDFHKTYQTQPQSWDASQVTVTVDSEKDIIENYRGTGRTMVVFHIQYAGADPAVYTGGRWIEGWGLHFRAYYDWKDLDIVQDGVNISAFMPEKGDLNPLLGTDEEVACDDGKIVPAGFEKDYEAFGSDINQDKITDIRNVLYARNVTIEDMAVANESKIEKQVRVDADRFGIYGSSAVVEVGGGYTYNIAVRNAAGAELKDIVVFDRLEIAYEDRKDVGADPFHSSFGDDAYWQGTFQSVVTSGLTEKGIKPVVYYNADRKAAIPERDQDPMTILTEANGWYLAEQFQEKTKMPFSEVKAVAVDISKKEDNSDFILGDMDSVSFQIKMKAPDTKPEVAVYAYNNPSFYSYSTKTKTPQTVIGDSVQVRMNENERLEVIKELEDQVPDVVRDTSFQFRLSRKVGTAFSNQEYQLFKKTKKGWVQQTDRLYATDGGGYLELHGDEKAVFAELPDAADIQVEETENLFWSAKMTDTTTEDAATGMTVRTVTVKNAFHPVLYVQKKLQAVPNTVDVSQETFTFRVRVKNENGEMVPLEDAEFWYVDSVRTDGGIPQKVTEQGINGTGRTDANGEFQIKAGEIIALFPGEAGVSYEVHEVLEPETDWLCPVDTVEGIVPAYGAYAPITNVYRWKDLYLIKNLTHQDPKDCKQEFTFRICKIEEDGTEAPAAGREWVLLNEDGTESTAEGESGVLDGDGTFTAVCGGRIVKIKGLEAGAVYTVTETVSGELYKPVNDTAEVTMPIYSSRKEAEITNDYLKRPLSVTKLIAGRKTDASAGETAFTMTVKVKGELLKYYPYTLIENGGIVEGTYQTGEDGTFSLKDGQTAVFQEVGLMGDSFEVAEIPEDAYPQIYPAGDAPHRGSLEKEGSSVTFINGQPGSLMFSKEYVGADEKGKEYTELMKDTADSTHVRENSSVTFRLEVTDKAGETYAWPKGPSKEVTVIDQLTANETQMGFPNTGITVKPWQMVMIDASMLKDVVSYTLTESAADQHRIFEWENGIWMEISQKDPAGDTGVSGTLEEGLVAKIVNEVSSFELEGSEIEKRMAVGSSEVPEGAKLVWRLERYDGTAWNPAEGISYLTFDDNGLTCNRTLITGEDGRIALTKTTGGYPKVKFVSEKVYLNRYADVAKGDLRLVELLEESDESWGVLAGYGTASDKYSYSLDMPSETAIAFVNTNRMAPVEIEKKMEKPSDAVFTMILKQVLSVRSEGGSVTGPDQILKSMPAAGISYTLYDSATGEETGSGVTDKNGGIRLKAGQYARLDLPDGSMWTVSEEQRADHVLKELTGTAGKTTKLENNLMLIHVKAKVVGILDVETEGFVLTGETFDKDNFRVRAVYSDQTWKDLTSDEFTLTPQKAADQPGLMDVTVYWEKGRLTETEKIQVVGKIAIDKDMVKAGVVDAQTGELVILNQGDVVIPGYIIWNGEMYKVTGIEEEAFTWCDNLTSIEIPAGVTSTGWRAFSYCSNLTSVNLPVGITSIGYESFYYCESLASIEIPAGVTHIRDGAFTGCGSLTSIKIPAGVKDIGRFAFSYCRNLISVDLPVGITSIEESTFSDCSSLTNVKIPAGVTSIGYGAFQNCGSLASIEIPSGVTSIGTSAFQNCGSLASIEIPASVTSIGFRAFYSCYRLTSIEIPPKVTVIESEVFYNCQKLTSVKIPAGVTDIESRAFEECRELTSIEIPASVVSIGNSAFIWCSKLTDITVHREPDSIPDSPWGAKNATVNWTGAPGT